MRVLSSAFTLSTVFAATLAQTGPEIAAYFKTHLSKAADVYLPSESNYSLETTQRWNANRAPSYVVSVKPASNQDVQEIIRYASQNKIAFLATGGGHGISVTLSTIQNGIEVDMSHFKTLSIDSAANTLTIGSAIRFGDVTGPLYDAGKEWQVGAQTCPGMVGASLGGGVGPYQGLHGLQLDTLLSATMITGTGALINVSATSHPELFWGMRGAGFNFGIVTSATYRIFDFTNNGQAMKADFRFHASKNGSLYEFARSYAGTMPDRFAIDIAIAYDERFGGTYIFANFIYVGPLEEGMTLLRPVIDIGAFEQNITEIPWKNIETESRFGINTQACTKGLLHSVWGLNLYQVDVPTLIDVVAYMDSVFAQYPAFRHSFLALDMYATRLTRSIPDDATAYPFRNAVGRFLLDVGFGTAANLSTAASDVGRHARSLFIPTSGANTSNIEVYVNYGHGDEGPLGWYTERKLPRLNALKDRYDPYKLFSHYNALQTNYDGPT